MDRCAEAKKFQRIDNYETPLDMAAAAGLTDIAALPAAVTFGRKSSPPPDNADTALK